MTFPLPTSPVTLGQSGHLLDHDKIATGLQDLQANPAIRWANVVTSYGATGDGLTFGDAHITATQATLTSSSATFTPADVGKLIAVTGAGAAGAGLATTIAGVTDAHTVTLGAAAGTTVSGAVYTYGTANDTAFANAIAAVPQPGSFPNRSVNGGTVYIPAGVYLISSTLNWMINGLKVVTDGTGATIIMMVTNNTPIMQVAGANQDIGGLLLTYPSQQPSANTSAIGIEFGDDTVGNCFECNYHELLIQNTQTGMACNPAMLIEAGLFSCTFTNIDINGYSQNGISFNANNSHGVGNATGCSFSNIYINNNNATAGGNALFLKNFDESVFNQLNIEHTTLTASDALLVSVSNDMTFNSTHFEAVTLSGDGHSLITHNSAGSLNFNSVTIRGNTFSGAASNPIINFAGTGPNHVEFHGVHEKNNTVTTPSHPFIGYGSATNIHVVVEGMTSSQTTANTTTANAGCLAQFGIAPGAAGIVPYTAGFTSFATGGAANLLNSSSGSSSVMTAGTWYYAALYIPYTVTLTGLIVTTGSVGGTDNWIVALWAGAGGAALANSALAGVAAPASNTKQAFPFTGTVTITGPGVYIAGVQSNGTTARLLTFSNAIEGFITGSVAGSFGTVPSLTPSGSYNASVGPFASTY